MKNKTLIIGLTAIILFLFFYISYLALKSNGQDEMPILSEDLPDEIYSVKDITSKFQPGHIADSFNYSEYLNHVSLNSTNSIQRNLIELDSFCYDPISGQKILSLALTDSLFSRISDRFDNYNADSLILLMQTIQSYKYYSKYPGKYQTFYDVVFSWWISKMSNLLDNYSIKNNGIKFSFKYKFLASQCKLSKSTVSPKVNEVEKIINNIAEQKWTYLYSRIWNTPILLRIMILLIGVLTVLSYLVSFKLIIDKIKKPKS
jgi:hypothetical protein